MILWKWKTYFYYCLELRQYKKGFFSVKRMLVLKLPPFFPSRVGEGKRAAISKQKQVRSYIVLALVNLVSTKGDLKVSVNLSYWLLLIFSYSIQFRKFLYSSLIVGFSLPFAHLFFEQKKKYSFLPCKNTGHFCNKSIPTCVMSVFCRPS